MDVKVFWCEPTKVCELSLRRYARNDTPCPSSNRNYHNASVVIGIAPTPAEFVEKGLVGGPMRDIEDVAHDDPRWPKTCSACSYEFIAEDYWQANADVLYEGAPDGKRHTVRTLPIGAMWDAKWWPGKGPDGIALYVRLPNEHDWFVDGPCNNCTRKGEEHYCWIRHGDPRKGEVHVDKSGDTCSAGAGSIQSGSYHGFLHNSMLTSC